MPVKINNQSEALVFPIEQTDEGKDTIGQLSQALEDYKKNYAEFIDIAVHDLDAPLRKLSILTDSLTSKYTEISQNDEQVQECIFRINRCITDMRSLVNGLSELANVTIDSMNYEACNIEEIVKKILEESGSEIKKKDVAITKSILPIIEGDVIQLKQLFKHILENAIRFNRKDIQPRINITSEKLTGEEKDSLGLPQTKEYYKIEISDQGIGFKQEFVQKIFQPFVRLNGKSAFEGNGLGLAICKRVVDNHEGKLFAESPESNGARFTLILPETRN